MWYDPTEITIESVPQKYFVFSVSPNLEMETSKFIKFISKRMRKTHFLLKMSKLIRSFILIIVYYVNEVT